MARTIYLPESDGVFTVRELIDILSTVDPDALVIAGRNVDNCNENIEQIMVSKYLVAFLTDPMEV